MASSISFQGRTTSIPGVFVSENTSALNAASLSGTGTVALIGEASGGTPYTALAGRSDIRAYSSAAAIARDFPAGDLLEAANLTFAATQDPALGGGAQFVVPIKANPATQASTPLAGSGGPSITVSALAYGLSGNLLTVAVAPGSSSGVKLTVTDGQTTEMGDNLGAEPVGSLSFSPQAGSGWQGMTGSVTGGAIVATGSLTLSGLSTDLEGTLSAPGTIAITAAAADASKTLTLYGLDASGAGQVEVLTLVAGAQSSSKTFSAVLGVALSKAAQDVKGASQGGAALFELAGDATSLGLFQGSGLAVASAPVQAHGTAGDKVVLAGLDASGSALVVAATLAAADQALGAFSVLQAVALGGVDPTHSVYLAAPAASVASSPLTTVAMAAGALRAIPGMVVTIQAQDAATPVTQLDDRPAQDLVAGPLSLVSEVRAVVDWAASSRLISISVPDGSVGLPSPTASPVHLSGGSDRPATAADYQACLNLLRSVRVNTVVALSGDPVVASAVDAHCALMCGVGQSERDAVVGIGGASGLPTFAEFTAGCSAVNSRHTRGVGQAVSVYNSQSVLTEFPPHFLAAMVAGMQASTTVGVPLTHKTVAVVGIRQDTSWTPMDDAEALLAAGACVFEQKDNIGIRMVRNLTTYTASENLALQEASVNEIVDYVAYNVRSALEIFVGQRAFSGSLNSISAQTTSLLTDLTTQGIVASYQPVIVSIVADTANVAITFAPVFPLNFILANCQVTLPIALTTSSLAA